MDRVPLALLLSFVFVAAMILVQGAWWAWRTWRVQQERDLARRLGVLGAEEEEERERLLRRDPRDPLARRLGSAGAWIQSVNLQAGRPTTVRALLTQSVLLGAVGVGLLAVLLKSPSGVVGAIFGLVPLVMLMRKADQRSAQLSAQLPDALDLVARSLQAGYGISEALRVCAEETQLPVAAEFGRVYEEHNLGRDFRDCMHNLMRRNPRNFDLRIFASSVLLQRETGGNMVEILQNIATTIRGRFTLQAKVKALTAEARFSAWILGMLPLGVGLLIAVLRPEYLLPLVADPIGRSMLTIAMLSYVVGLVVMKNLSEIDA